MEKNLRYYLPAIISGVLATIAYSYANFGFLIWVSFIPFFWGLSRSPSNNKNRWLSIFYYGLLTGLVYFIYSFRWFLSIFPLDNAHAEKLWLVIIVAIWLITSLGMAFLWGVFAILTKTVLNKIRVNSRLIRITLGSLSITSIFALLEFSRSFVMSVIWYGAGTLWGPHWTIGSIAYSLSNSSLILRLSSYIGIYGITFLIILTNSLVYFYYNYHSSRDSLEKKRYIIFLFAIIVIAITLITYLKLPYRKSPTDKAIKISIVQTKRENSINPSPSDILKNFHKQSELLELANKEGSDVIVFPEGSDLFKNFSYFLKPAQIQNYFNRLSSKSKLIIDNSSVSLADGTTYSRVAFLDTKKDIIGYYDKKLLTPGGEYLPYGLKIFAAFMGIKTQNNSAPEFSRGEKETIATFEGNNFLVGVCSDMLSPNIIRQKTNIADILIGMASSAMFHGNNSIINQSLAVNRFRSAENHTPLVLSANYGRSYALDNNGNILKISQNTEPQILTVEVVLPQDKSWYNKVGDWPTLLSSSLILLISLASLLVFKKK